MKMIKRTALLLAAIFISGTVSVYAADSTNALPKLTLSDAVKRVRQVSTTLANYKDNITKLEEARDKLNKNANFNTTSEVLSYQDSLAANKISLDEAKISYTTEYDNIEINVTNAFISVLNAEDSLALYDKNMVISEKNFKITEVKKELGLISESDYITAKTSIEKSRTSRADKLKDVDDAYRVLNKLLDYNFSNRYELVFDIEYAPLQAVNLTSYIDKLINLDQTIKSNNAQIETYEYQIETYTLRNVIESTGEIIDKTDSREAIERSIDQKNRSTADRKKTIEDSITSSYNQIIADERKYEQNIADLQNKYTQYEIKKVQFEIGKITQLDLDNALYEINSLESTIRLQVYNHHVSVLKFNNVNLVTKSSSY